VRIADFDAPEEEKATVIKGKTRKKRPHFHIFPIETLRLLFMEKILKKLWMRYKKLFEHV